MPDLPAVGPLLEPLGSGLVFAVTTCAVIVGLALATRLDQLPGRLRRYPRRRRLLVVLAAVAVATTGGVLTGAIGWLFILLIIPAPLVALISVCLVAHPRLRHTGPAIALAVIALEKAAALPIDAPGQGQRQRRRTRAVRTVRGRGRSRIEAFVTG